MTLSPTLGRGGAQVLRLLDILACCEVLATQLAPPQTQDMVGESHSPVSLLSLP